MNDSVKGKELTGGSLEEQLSNAFIVAPISDPATRHIPGSACPQISCTAAPIEPPSAPFFFSFFFFPSLSVPS